MTSPSAAIFAGESSGDVHGAHLVRALQDYLPGTKWWGVGGSALAEAGVELVFDSSAWGAMGFLESFRKGLRIYGRMLHCRDLIAERRPDLIILVDFGGFNIHLARRGTELGHPVFWYMPPGAWSRQPRNFETIARNTDCVATPFPWSEELLRAAGVNAHFVGHPLLDIALPPTSVDASEQRREACQSLGLDPDQSVVAYFPASRTTELRDIWPAMAAAAELVEQQVPGCQHVVGVAPSLPVAALEAGSFTRPARMTYTRKVYQALAAADVVLTKSGTVTLEAAIFQKPMVIVYRGNWLMRLEYRLCYRNRIRHVGMPNILAQEEICPELLDNQATPPAMAALLSRWILEPESTRAMRSRLAGLNSLLGTPGAVQRAAKLAADLLASTRSSPSTPS